MTTLVLPRHLRLTTYAHQVVAKILGPGDTALDATVGNGHDTKFLLDQVGPIGIVWGFDIQSAALSTTQARCGEHPGLRLIQQGHENLESWVNQPLQAVMFNLGYLPSGDKSLITQTSTTLKGLRAAMRLLAPGGILTALVYRGHPGGAHEAAAVEETLLSATDSSWRVTKAISEAGSLESPSLLVWQN
jgi:ubiquinone/menaquinone biosynthesis C-methylase UbiE